MASRKRAAGSAYAAPGAKKAANCEPSSSAEAAARQEAAAAASQPPAAGPQTAAQTSEGRACTCGLCIGGIISPRFASFMAVSADMER
jgi:hypothetical protein